MGRVPYVPEQFVIRAWKREEIARESMQSIIENNVNFDDVPKESLHETIAELSVKCASSLMEKLDDIKEQEACDERYNYGLKKSRMKASGSWPSIWKIGGRR